jgi:hypothetical protein
MRPVDERLGANAIKAQPIDQTSAFGRARPCAQTGEVDGVKTKLELSERGAWLFQSSFASQGQPLYQMSRR